MVLGVGRPRPLSPTDLSDGAAGSSSLGALEEGRAGWVTSLPSRWLRDPRARTEAQGQRYRTWRRGWVVPRGILVPAQSEERRQEWGRDAGWESLTGGFMTYYLFAYTWLLHAPQAKRWSGRTGRDVSVSDSPRRNGQDPRPGTSPRKVESCVVGFAPRESLFLFGGGRPASAITVCSVRPRESFLGRRSNHECYPTDTSFLLKFSR